MENNNKKGVWSKTKYGIGRSFYYLSGSWISTFREDAERLTNIKGLIQRTNEISQQYRELRKRVELNPLKAFVELPEKETFKEFVVRNKLSKEYLADRYSELYISSVIYCFASIAFLIALVTCIFSSGLLAIFNSLAFFLVFFLLWTSNAHKAYQLKSRSLVTGYLAFLYKPSKWIPSRSWSNK